MHRYQGIQQINSLFMNLPLAAQNFILRHCKFSVIWPFLDLAFKIQNAKLNLGIKNLKFMPNLKTVKKYQKGHKKPHNYSKDLKATFLIFMSNSLITYETFLARKALSAEFRAKRLVQICLII